MADHKINILIGIKQHGTKMLGAAFNKIKAGLKSIASAALKATALLTGAGVLIGKYFIKAAADAAGDTVNQVFQLASGRRLDALY